MTTARLARLAQNGVTVVGAVLVTVTAILIVSFLAVELGGGIHNPYVGIVAYVVLPALFLLGLLAIPVGMALQKRRLRRSGERLGTDFPVLDFNEPKLRRIAIVVIALTVINAVILGSTSFLAVEKMDTVEFCGETCHTVMQPEATAYAFSPHSRVHCVQCHIGPGASWFVRSKLDGVRQVWHTAWNTFSRPIETPITDLRPARETCEQCHWPGKHFGDKVRVFARFRSDEANTPEYTAMVLRTGGGSLDMGRHGGIHWWHIESDNRIRYLAGDRRRLEITWVELVTPGGETRVYTRDAEAAPSTEALTGARTMDCIDCHNRPTHDFPTPDRAIDWVLETYPELRELPSYKRESVSRIEAEYASRDEGLEAVRSGVLEYYRAEHPEVAGARRSLVERGADLTATVYGRISFPEMRTSWETHPNHIGHDESPGCFRCHDGEMASVDGEHVIPVDCETCHVFVLEGDPVRPDLATLELGG
jgi:hypothetical protein